MTYLLIYCAAAVFALGCAVAFLQAVSGSLDEE